MRRLIVRSATLLLAAMLSACGSATATPSSAPSSAAATATGATPPPAATWSGEPSSTLNAPPPVTLLFDTDVAPDDLVALSFLLRAPNVTIAAITVSGTGEATCAHGPAVVLGLLERLSAPEIPVACGREIPLRGTHTFPDAWRMGADAGSGLQLPTTTRTPATGSAVDLIRATAVAHGTLTVLATGPLTNLADALAQEAGLAQRLHRVVIMGGAVEVPGNILGPGAPTGNDAAEWNIYVDPHAAQVVLDAGVHPEFVSLDGTNQVPVTTDFVARIRSTATGAGAKVLSDLFDVNPFMAGGGYYLWDPLAAEAAAGFEIGTFTPAAIAVTEAEGPESGATRAVSGTPNAAYLSTANAGAAEDILLEVLNRP